MARRIIATKDNTITSQGTEPLSREVARPIFGESVLAIDYNFAEKDYLDDDITFSRSSGATQRNKEGKVAFAPHNLLIHSEAFDQWGNAAVATANTHPNPIDGLITADTVGSNGGVKHRTISVTLPQADTYIFSIYLKRKTGTGIIRIGDFTDGTNEVAVTDEWQRFSRTATLAAGAHTFTLRIDTTDDEVYAWGAQVERRLDGGTTPTDYNKTSGAVYQAPRFDYDKDGNSKGLLIEEGRTNLFKYTDLSNSSSDGWDWLISGSGTTIANATTDPTGGNNAVKIIANTNNTLKLFSVNSVPTVSSGTTVTASLYVKNAGGRYVVFYLNDSGSRMLRVDLQTGQITSNSADSGTIEALANDWYRISFTRTLDANLGSVFISPSLNGQDVSFAGDGSNGIFVWGAQFEQGSFPTSLIPTYGATASRSGDVAKVDSLAFSRFYKQGTGGAWLVDSTELAEDRTTPSSPFLVYESNGSKLRVGPKIGGGATNTIAAYYQDGGDMIYSAGSSLGTVTKGVKSKLGITFQTNDGAFTRDGKNPNVDTSIANIYSPTVLRLGGNGSGTTVFCGHIARLRYYNKRISNNKLKKETDTPFLLNKYPRAKAAHSLRALMDDSANSPVTRIRREYDSYEADYTAAQVSNGDLEKDFRSTDQTTLPLDVSVEADEMIVGGDFTEKVTNGGFDSDSGWTKGSGATIGSGVATIAVTGGGYTYIKQNLTYVAGRKYTVIATVNGTSSKQVRILDHGSNQGGLQDTQTLTTLNGSDQTLTFNWTANSNSDSIQFDRVGTGDWSFTVDNVSVVEGSWSLGTHFRVAEEGNRIERFAGGSSENSAFTQTIPIKKGRTYKVEYDVTHTSGNNYTNVYINTGNGYITTNQLNGSGHSSDTFLALTNGNLLMQFYGIGDFRGFWDNVSVKEVNPIATGFSTRKINSSYTGKAMRCRNQGNVEVEVGFDSNNEISLSSPVTNTSQNLLAYSEDFGQWGYHSTYTPTLQKGIADPFGGNNAGLLTAGGSHNASQVKNDNLSLTSGTHYTASLYIKKGTSTKTRLGIYQGSWIFWAETTFDASGVPSSTGNLNATNISYEKIGDDGWYRFSFVGKATATASNHSLIFYPDRNATNKNTYIFGAQLEETQYESTGTEQITNGDFSNGSTSWDISNNAGGTVEVTNGALRIASTDSSSNFVGVSQDINYVAGKKYKITFDYVASDLNTGSAGLTVVHPESTMVFTTSGAKSIEFTASSTAAHSTFFKRRMGSQINDFTIDNVSILEYDPELQTYAQTPVISNDGSSTTATTLGEFSGLENLLRNSEDFSSVWNVANGTITANQGTDPNGGNGADLFKPTSDQPNTVVYQTATGVTGGTYVTSVYAKASGKNFINMRGVNDATGYAWFNLSNGTVGTVNSSIPATIESVGNDWYRCSVTQVADSTTETFVLTVNDADNSFNVTVNGNDGVLLWGAQLNTNSLKTYQKTTGTALTGDVNVVNWYNQGGGEDATQDTANNQPRIVKGSELVTSGGKAALDFDGAGSGNTDHLDILFLRYNSRFDMFAMYDTDDTQFSILHDTQNGILLATTQDGSSTTWKNSNFANADSKAYVNGAILSADTRDVLHDQGGSRKLVTFENCYTSSIGSLNIGLAAGDTSWSFSGKICELIMFPNMNPSQKRFEIEQNIISAYDLSLAQANFETNVNGLGPSNALGATATITHETTDPLTGSGSAKVSISGAVGATSYPRLYGNNAGVDNLFLPVNPVVGEKYKITMTTKLISGTVQMIGIGFGDQGGNGSNGEVSGEDITFSGTQTHVFEKTLTSVAGSNTGRIHIAFNGEHTGVFLIDSIKIEKTGVRGFVTKLYDQTGNNCHALQATAANQPQIVSGGDLIKSGNHPALEFTQTSPNYSNLEIHGVNAARADSWFVTDTSSTQHIYPSQHDNGGRHGWIAQDGDSNIQAHLGYGGEPVRLYTNGTLIGGYDITRDDVHAAINGRKLVHHQDGDTTDWTITQFGWYGEGNAVSSHIPWGYEGKMSEMIWYDSDQSSNRTGIESNINTHYNIY
tara:strand:- start:17669 stop:23776 length:6108 start_codon:yes stop_codon:yes gene_type:complete